jgi:hypothetical protein
MLVHIWDGISSGFRRIVGRYGADRRPPPFGHRPLRGDHTTPANKLVHLERVVVCAVIRATNGCQKISASFGSSEIQRDPHADFSIEATRTGTLSFFYPSWPRYSLSMSHKTRRAHVTFTEPMECLAVKRLPDGPEWVYELLCCAQHKSSYVVSEIMLCRERFIRRHGSVRRS